MFRQTVLSTLMLSLFLTGCTVARMEVPSNMPVTATEMPVEGRKAFSFDESFSFEAYEVLDVQRGWKVTTAWGIFGFESSNARETFEFRLRHKEQSLTANCATDLDWKSIESENFLDTGGTMNWELSSDLVFACTFTGARHIWKMVMDQDTQSVVMNGIATDSKGIISIEGTQRLAGSDLPLLDPTGYYFSKKGQHIGAVEVINNGAVWIDTLQANELQSALAGVSAALLLYQDLKE